MLSRSLESIWSGLVLHGDRVHTGMTCIPDRTPPLPIRHGVSLPLHACVTFNSPTPQNTPVILDQDVCDQSPGAELFSALFTEQMQMYLTPAVRTPRAENENQ
ncbi:hypothetical protein J6590_002210 [Homalodisca vitripennis]|nr:hypothetical protein J6590_002210 [Homalodisca vitripennis]